MPLTFTNIIFNAPWDCDNGTTRITYNLFDIVTHHFPFEVRRDQTCPHEGNIKVCMFVSMQRGNLLRV